MTPSEKHAILDKFFPVLQATENLTNAGFDGEVLQVEFLAHTTPPSLETFEGVEVRFVPVKDFPHLV